PPPGERPRPAPPFAPPRPRVVVVNRGGGGNVRQRRGIVFVQRLVSCRRRAIEFFCVGQDALFRLQLLIFVGLQFGGLDLFFLETPQVSHAQPVLFIAIKLCQALAHASP